MALVAIVVKIILRLFELAVINIRFDSSIFRKGRCGDFTIHPYKWFILWAHMADNMSDMTYCQHIYSIFCVINEMKIYFNLMKL